MDALQSFTFLTDNLPTWISNLDRLATQVTDKHNEFVQLTRETRAKARAKKQGSTETLRAIDAGQSKLCRKPTLRTESLRQRAASENHDTAVLITGASTPPAQIDINPNNKHLFQDSRRKRKSVSVLSGKSGPQKYQARSTIIVYYDSAIQEAFELLVRNIGSARNNLRKGRTAANFKARMASLGLGLDDSLFPGVGNFSMPKSRAVDPRSGKNSDIATTKRSEFQGFDDADKALEVAQSLCEVAAHQFLRDGDCRDEIATTRVNFESCLKVAEAEAIQLRDQARIEQEREEISSEKDTPVADTVVAQPSLASKQTGFSGMDAIEVDSASDQSSIHIDLTAFRRTRRV
ncbi:hypothetical protein MMC20_005900 [Loxospora ochrophaea]|nr:hypothetical protein [Loxospora ochrophaea]